MFFRKREFREDPRIVYAEWQFHLSDGRLSHGPDCSTCVTLKVRYHEALSR
jgi:hypothetical protein